jgi:quinol-cytochrome oxidoreductase complex cytochrome b subunit
MARATPGVGVEGPGASLLTLNGVSLITSGSDAKFAPAGGPQRRRDDLNRFYVLHCVAIPLAVALLIMIHFWRVRKDGGISGPM